MELRNIVEIKRRQRIARATLSSFERAPLCELPSGAAAVLRQAVQKDLPALVEENERLAGELVEVRGRFRQTDPAAYDWYFGSVGEEKDRGRGRGRGRRQPGSAAGRIIIHDDFDDPLPEEMLAAFEEREPTEEPNPEGSPTEDDQERRR